MNFILTIDTEADNQWDFGREITVKNIKYIKPFQALCEEYHVKPTYLVTSEVCSDEFAREFFSEVFSKGRCEIGAHLHSWTTPPFQDIDGYRYNDSCHAYATDLPTELLKEKVRNLTNHISNAFNVKPLSFRSGRYGFNKILAEILVENSYVVDSSVTPFVSWEDIHGIAGGPDFINYPAYPFKYDFEKGSLIELPITILPTRFPFNRNRDLADFYFRNVDKNYFLRIIRKLLFKRQPLWLRPMSWMNLNLFEELVDEAIRIRLPYIVMMFHSSELMPGGSSYRKSEESIEELYNLLKEFFNMINIRKIDTITLTEAAKNICL